MESDEDRQSSKIIAAAIDFGTTFSGWAFQFIHDFQRNPTRIHAKSWNNGTNISMKTPTTALFKPDGKTLEAFGYDVENLYADLVKEEDQNNWFYFSRFKMKLYENMKLKRTMMLEAANGKELPAIDIFSSVIRYLKDDLTKMSRQQKVDHIHEDEYLWVLTVPAIWTDAAKQFMREAAVKAGIKDECLVLALEPEAASVFCKYEAYKRDTGSGMKCFTPGSRYIVIDAGGGTVDITVHEILKEGNIRELHPPVGGYWGGTTVDKQFEQFLEDIFGVSVMDTFRKEAPDDYIEFLRIFEIKKRDISVDNKRPVYLNIPFFLAEIYKTQSGHSLTEAIKSSKYAETDSMEITKRNQLKFGSDILRGFFEYATKKIIGQVETLLNDEFVTPCNTILLVGGFSESPIIAETLKADLKNVIIVTSSESSLTVLKGSVLFGRQQSIISERIARFTYGHQIRLHSEEDDPIEFLVEGDKTTLCRQRFAPIVKKGTVVANNKQCAAQYQIEAIDSKGIRLDIYRSNAECPRYVTDDGCAKIGTMEVNTENGESPSYNVCGIFGGTEIKLLLKNIETGSITAASFDNL